MHAVREGFELIRTFSYRMGVYTPAYIYIVIYIYIYILSCIYIFILVCIAIVKEGTEAATHTRHTLDHHAGESSPRR